ncbi:hypothetical protein [Arthrobacter antibioticus]|uniref:hypothetical protein n=1 Tax=Arthrobacter sp. H35-MC1 TaxID=3046203 RepID=UPI0024B8D8EE|nr:hypothetical protein [Arthrobacter sp. H35-MC1]MDJ0318647.1 hypothetical protein [Arthrobacter sp. H35-MC1]
MPLRGWLTFSFLSFLAIGVTYFIGIFASGKDIDETCAKSGQLLDNTYRAQNWLEPGQFFPLHNKCNAAYDMIPVWVNPALVIFAVLTATFVCAFIVAAAKRLKAHRRESQVSNNP